MMVFLVSACEDEYHVNLDEIYGEDDTEEENWNTDREIIACGDRSLMIINIGKASMTNVPYEWEWNSADADDLSASVKSRLAGMDECKVVNEGDDQLILSTSSGGAAVILSRNTKNCLFYADNLQGPHSIELLPNNRVIIAGSDLSSGKNLWLYDRSRSNDPILIENLPGGHGVIWIESRQLLYAIGYDELRAYSLQDWNTDSPKLKIEKTWDLPTNDGHDLIRISDDKLGFTTVTGVYEFDINSETITPFEPLEGMVNIKSFNYEEETGYLVYTKATVSWWTYDIQIQNPDKVLHISDVNLYKVRTVPEREQSEN